MRWTCGTLSTVIDPGLMKEPVVFLADRTVGWSVRPVYLCVYDYRTTSGYRDPSTPPTDDRFFCPSNNRERDRSLGMKTSLLTQSGIPTSGTLWTGAVPAVLSTDPRGYTWEGLQSADPFSSVRRRLACDGLDKFPGS